MQDSLTIWPWAVMKLSVEEQIKLNKILYKDSKAILSQNLRLAENALKSYKERANKLQQHDLKVQAIRDKKKARRLRNKAKGPRK